MNNENPHLKFLPNGSYDLSTPERRVAAAEAALANIVTLAGIAQGASSPASAFEYTTQVIEQAGALVRDLRAAREHDTARAVIGIEELNLTEMQIREVLWIEGLLDDSSEPLTVAALSTVIEDYHRPTPIAQLMYPAVRAAALRAVRIDTSAARPIHTVDNLTDEQVEELAEETPASAQRQDLIDACMVALGEVDEPVSEAAEVAAREKIVAELNERRLLAACRQ